MTSIDQPESAASPKQKTAGLPVVSLPGDGPAPGAGLAAGGPLAALPHAAGSQAGPGAALNYELLLDCVHCGLCTSACPTYLELGDENDGPRGRIYLMRGVTDGRIPLTQSVKHHLELCLDCRACETACPSGVQYGKLIEPFRLAMESADSAESGRFDWFKRFVLHGVFPYPRRMRAAIWPARIAQKTGLVWLAESLGLVGLLPNRLRQLVRMLPPSLPAVPALPEFTPAKGRRRARVALFTGCVGDVMFRHTHHATIRVLAENGCDVLVPSGQVCCGAIHYHSGASEPAKHLAGQNLQALDISGVDAVIANVAGCGAMLKEYGHFWHDEQQGEREAFAGKVKDVHEFLGGLGLIAPQGEIRLKATYHDACHLAHAQKVKEAPRKLLAAIPGLQLVDLAESEVCCGAAGTYNLTQPEMSQRLSERKWRNIEATGASILLTGNAGCLLQIQREARQQTSKVWVAHPMDLLDLSYRGEQPPTG